MFQTDQPTASNALPTPAAAGTQGYFTNGNPASGVAATIVDADWLNMIQLELINLTVGGGQTPSKTTYNQILLAIQQLIANRAPGVVGSMRNAQMSVTAASATATFGADQIVVGTSLTGLQYVLGSFNKTINLATTGAGGMDTGIAPTSGYVALYAIYNPTTGTSALLATNATSAVAPNVYGGANMPSGYTASGLVSVWPTNGSGQFVIGNQFDRDIKVAPVTISLGGAAGSYTSASIASAVPKNAKTASGFMTLSNNTANTGNTLNIASTSGGIGVAQIQSYLASANGVAAAAEIGVQLPTAQTIYYNATTNSGTMTNTFIVSGYAI